MTPRRQTIISLYTNEIEAAYNAVEESAQAELSGPSSWTEEATRDFVRSNVKAVLRQNIPDNESIFEYGGDRCGWFTS